MSCYSTEPDPFPAPAPRYFRISAAASTDTGQERADNQDRAAFANPAADQAWEPPAVMTLEAPPGAFYALVCDGMGGEAGGALASGLAVETTVGAMRACWARAQATPAGSPSMAEAQLARALVASLEAAAARIKRVAREEPVYARMGTTATLAAIAHDALVCAQVGDSRAYLLRGDRLIQLTRDQTMAELLRSSSGLSREQVAEVVGSNVILQALGSSTNLEVIVNRTPLANDDVVLLCSDGLYGVVSDPEIMELLRGASDLAAACHALVARANANGGPDNITCVAFRVTSDALPEAAQISKQ